MQKIAVASLDERRYAETFSVFVAHSREYPLIIDSVVEIVRRLKPGFRMLDVGAGTGHVIQSLMQQSGVEIGHYTAFEPNPAHSARLETTLRALKLKNYELHAESFSHTTALAERYDLVLFSHSLYWMADPARCFLHSARALNPDGFALALLQGPYGVHAMFHLFEPCLERTSAMLQNNAFSSHELISGLRELGADPVVRMLPTAIDLTGLFDEGRFDELSEFVSFCMQVEFGTLPDPFCSDILDYIRGGCVEAGGKTLWYLPNAAVTLSA